jgi:hypothetical protein
MNNIRKAPWVYPQSGPAKQENKIIDKSRSQKIDLTTTTTSMGKTISSTRSGVAGGSGGTLSYNTKIKIPKSGVLKK